MGIPYEDGEKICTRRNGAIVRKQTRGQGLVKRKATRKKVKGSFKPKEKRQRMLLKQGEARAQIFQKRRGSGGAPSTERQREGWQRSLKVKRGE